MSVFCILLRYLKYYGRISQHYDATGRLHRKGAVTTGYVDSLLAMKISGVQTALETYRAAAKQNIPDFYAILSQAMAVGGTAASDTTRTTDSTGAQALYAALAESAVSSGSEESDLSGYASIMLGGLSGLSEEDLSLYGLGLGTVGYSDANALYASMLAKQLAGEDEG